MGYEGVIIRCLSIGATSEAEKKKSLYQSGKCNHFFKLKPFKDEEGVIIGMLEGKGKYKGAARLLLRDPRGNTLTVLHHGNVKEKQAAYENWKRNPNEYLGRLYKYKYQGLTDNGNVRHPTAIAYRDVDQPP